MKPLKILYASGPVDAASAYRHWLDGEIDPKHCTIPFVHQFYDLCKELGAHAYVISRAERPDYIKDENFTIRHSPVPFQHHSSSLLYYFGQLLVGLQLILSVLTYRPDFLVIQSGRVFPLFLSPIAWMGVKVIPSYHVVLWPKYKEKTKAMNLVWHLSQRLFQEDCTAVLSTSKDITEQIKELASGSDRPVIEFLSIYQENQFDQVKLPPVSKEPFNVLFVGRINENKGVFELLEIAKRFKSKGHTQIIFYLCGTGPDLETLKEKVAEAGLEKSFVCQGYCKRSELMQMYEQSHIVIVPTTTDFAEGLNQVVLEGVLAGRPVITSAVCPAIHYVREAVVEVLPDDTQGYGDAILDLYGNSDLYDEKRQACSSVQGRFYDSSEGWGAKLKHILNKYGAVEV